ncbi:hypothetical protein SY88_00195 [Clostridiales bacterium PH28_bin88]|nr:hypothetical protein SY88_00195 [Clostridiales bacterium PH28_bin88]
MRSGRGGSASARPEDLKGYEKKEKRRVNKMIISVDVGYGFTKAISEYQRSVVFPSLVAPGQDRSMEGIFGAGQSGLDCLHVRVNGQEFFVGDLARRGGMGASFTLETWKIGHQNTRVLLATAVALLAPAGVSSVHLATGLPYEDYRHQRHAMEEMLKTFRAEVEFLGGPLIGERRSIRFHQTTVFPQAAGAVYASLDTQTLAQVAGSGRLISVVDMGYKTTDVVTFEAGQAFRLRPDLSGTVDQGMNDLERHVLAVFTERTGRRLDPARAGRLLAEGGAVVTGKFLDLGEEINRARKALAGLIMDKVRLIWRDQADFIWRVYLVGGGCTYLAEALQDLHPATHLVEDAQMANTRGFLAVARQRERNLPSARQA